MLVALRERVRQVRYRATFDDALAGRNRSDCAELCTLTENTAELGPTQYCAENPCGAVDSVRASRANWCPGSMTGPLLIEEPALAQPGQHTVDRRIPELHEYNVLPLTTDHFEDDMKKLISDMRRNYQRRNR